MPTYHIDIDSNDLVTVIIAVELVACECDRLLRSFSAAGYRELADRLRAAQADARRREFAESTER